MSSASMSSVTTIRSTSYAPISNEMEPTWPSTTVAGTLPSDSITAMNTDTAARRISVGSTRIIFLTFFSSLIFTRLMLCNEDGQVGVHHDVQHLRGKHCQIAVAHVVGHA